MNHAPIMAGHIDHRVLLNYRVDLDVARAWLPYGFRPRAVDGYAIAGICAIRLSALRPKRFPAALGVTTDNAAHRMAVEFDTSNGADHGVFVHRRDTSSKLTRILGGRLFPGSHSAARVAFHVDAGQFDIQLDTLDGTTHIAVAASLSESAAADSVFPTLDAASAFFHHDPIGYSPTRRPGVYDAMELEVARWQLSPLAVHRVESSVFADDHTFPPGSIAFDSAFLMHSTGARWIPRPAFSPADEPDAATRTRRHRLAAGTTAS